MGKKTIIRAAHGSNNPYVMILREIPQNKALSWEARGVLCYLLSQPDDWRIQVEDLKQNCGEHTVYRVLKELKEAGYLHHERTINKAGKFVAGDYLLYEQPRLENRDEVKRDDLREEQPRRGFPRQDFPRVENRDVKEHIDSFSTNVEKDVAPEIEKKPRKKPVRSDIFIAVARESFQVFDVDALDGSTVTRINKLVKWLKDNSPGATADTLVEFYKWYDRKTSKAARPRDAGKFGEYFIAFKQQALASHNRQASPAAAEQARIRRLRMEAERAELDRINRIAREQSA